MKNENKLLEQFFLLVTNKSNLDTKWRELRYFILQNQDFNQEI